MNARTPNMQDFQSAYAAPVFAYQAPKRNNFWSSLGLAFTIEIACAALIACYLIFRQVAPTFTSLPIQIEDTPKTEPVKQEIKKPEPPKPKIEPKPIKTVQPPPTPVAPSPQVQATPVVEAPNAFTAPTPVPVPAPVVSKQVGPSDEFKAKVQAAVQAAFYYPMAAQEMGLTGRTRVGFVLTNTTASEAKIVTSSSIGIIDRAALQAVIKAVFPTPPADLKDKALAYEIWIEFKPKAN
jgi:hypothetical protein